MGRYFYKLICWDRALILWKKNLPGRSITKVEKRCSMVCCGPRLSVHFPSFLLVFGHCRPIFYSHIVIILFSLISPSFSWSSSFPCSSIVTVTICFGILLLVNLKLYRTKFNVVRRTVLEVISSNGSVSFVIV